jgi:hypothetical protein
MKKGPEHLWCSGPMVFWIDGAGANGLCADGTGGACLLRVFADRFFGDEMQIAFNPQTGGTANAFNL